MRRALNGALMALAVTLTMTATAAPQPDKSLLGIRILSDWKTVLAKFGQPTRVEAGPLATASVSPMTSMGGQAMSQPPMMGGMAGIPGLSGPMTGGLAGPPMGPMMGGMASAGGGAPRAPMMGGMSSAGGGRGLPGLGGMGGGITAPGGSSMMMAPPMMGGGGMTAPGRPGMGGMSSAGGSSMMMRPPMMSGGMTAPGMGNPRMGLGAGNPRMGGGSLGVGAEMPGMDLMIGGAPGMTTGMGAAASGGGTQAGEGEVTWVYEKGTTTHVFLFNKDGRVIQIQSFGYAAGAKTLNGVGLGDSSAKIYQIYGFPEQTIVSGNTRTLDYSEKANVAFQLAERPGKGMRVVGITVGLVKAPDPENPEK